MVCPCETTLCKQLHAGSSSSSREQVHNDWGEGGTHCSTICLFKEVLLELEIGYSQAQLHKFYQLTYRDVGSLSQGLVLGQLLFHNPQPSSIGTLMKRLVTSKLTNLSSRVIWVSRILSAKTVEFFTVYCPVKVRTALLQDCMRREPMTKTIGLIVFPTTLICCHDVICLA